MKSLLAAAVLSSLSLPAAAQSLVPVTDDQVAAFLKRFQVTSVTVQAGPKKDLSSDKAFTGLVGQVLDAASQRDPVDPDLPLAMQPDPAAGRQQHLVFYDTHDEHFLERWKKQTELLRAGLLRQGVPADNIQIHPLETREDFFCMLSSVEGPRRVYFFGHGSPLVMHIGDEDVRMAEHAGTLQEEQVQVLTHYGCSFVNVSTGDLAGLQAGLREGTRITLVGHRLPSTPEDDRLFDRDNPVVRVNVSRDDARMHFAADELAGRIGALGQLAGAPITGIVPAVAGAGLSVYAGERGRAPERLAEPPSIFELFFTRMADRFRHPKP
ncbi:MAG: hypothetical protein WC728_14790 [Elusimicrobiota bacterium]